LGAFVVIAALNEATPPIWIWASLRFRGPDRSSRTPGDQRDPDRDEDLIARALHGDRQAFDDLYRRHVDLVWGRLGRLIGPDPEREDLVQQIFLEVFRCLPRFRGDARFATFLYRVMLNLACDHLKRRGKRAHLIPLEHLDDFVDGAGSPEQRAAERQRLALTLQILDRIKPKKRVAFLLRTVEGLSLEEIAEIVEATPAAVAQRVRHAHLELCALLDRAGLEAGGLAKDGLGKTSLGKTSLRTKDRP
jgi:RNA polymerase sigma-70 factor (ECF subfamily)